MANCSNAFGQVTITALNREFLSQVLKAHILSEERTAYDITLSSLQSVEDVDQYLNENIIEESDGKVSINDNFTGTGRWSITNNFEWFWSELLTEHDNYPQELKDALPELKNQQLNATFKYKDEESGSQFLGTGTYETVWNPNIQRVENPVDSWQDYEYNVDNMIELEFYDEWDVIDGKFIDGHWDEFEPDGELKDLIDKYPQKMRELIRDNLYILYGWTSDEILEVLEDECSDELEKLRKTPRELNFEDYFSKNSYVDCIGIYKYEVETTDGIKNYQASSILTAKQVAKIIWSREEGVQLLINKNNQHIDITYNIRMIEIADSNKFIASELVYDPDNVFNIIFQTINTYLKASE